MALADMLEMRVLPKLRGVELESPARNGLQNICRIVRQRLSDQVLADRIESAMRSTDMFTWTG